MLNVPQCTDKSFFKLPHLHSHQPGSFLSTFDNTLPSESLSTLSILSHLSSSSFGVSSSPSSYDIRGVTSLSYGSLDGDVPLLRLLLWGNPSSSSSSLSQQPIPNWNAFSPDVPFTLGGVISCGCADGTVSIIDLRVASPLHVWNANAHKNSSGFLINFLFFLF
jgi:hypothetical protein